MAANGSVQYTFPWKLKLNADYGWKHVHYLHNNVFFGVMRKETEHSFNVALFKALTENLTISIEWLYRNNDANLALFDYSKNIYSIGATWRF